MTGAELALVIIIGIIFGSIVLLNWADAFQARGVAKWQAKGRMSSEDKAAKDEDGPGGEPRE